MQTKRISLIGPGDLNFHYYTLLKYNNSSLNLELENIARTLSKSKHEITLLPDKGVSFEIAKLYRINNGKKIIGIYPKSDKLIGTLHLNQYIESKINNKKLFDEFIDSKDWFFHDMASCLFSDAIFCLGKTPGTDGERSYAVYLYKFFKGLKENFIPLSKKLHPEIRIKDNFSIILYSPFFLSKKLPFEDEEYMKKYGINLFYADNNIELEKILKNL